VGFALFVPSPHDVLNIRVMLPDRCRVGLVRAEINGHTRKRVEGFALPLHRAPIVEDVSLLTLSACNTPERNSEDDDRREQRGQDDDEE